MYHKLTFDGEPILIVTISQNPIFFVSTQPVRYPNISYGSRDSVSGSGRIHIRGIVVIIAAATIPFGWYVPYVYICVMWFIDIRCIDPSVVLFFITDTNSRSNV